MAIVTVPRFYIFNPWVSTFGGYAQGASIINASGDRIAFVIQVPKTGTLDKFELRVAGITNSPDNGIRLSFQDVSTTTGDPDGTQDQYRDIAAGSLSANSWTVPGLMTHNGTDGGNKRSVTRGELLACVVDFVTFVASDSITFSTLSISTGLRNIYFDDAATGTYVKNAAAFGLLALKYDDGTYGEFVDPCWPALTINNTAFGSGSTPDERALRFQIPTRMRCIGAWVQAALGANADIVLYDNSSSVLASVSIDSDQKSNANGGVIQVLWSSSITLEPDTTYRLAVKPTTASTVTFQDFDLPGAAYQACMPGGATWYYSSRTDAGAWSDTDTKRPIAGLIFDGVDTYYSSVGGGGHSAYWG